MKETLICLAVALIVGLLMSRLAKKLNLPAVTAYLIGGLLIGPFCLGALNLQGLGFNSLEQVHGLNIITQTALGFIAFAIGNEFRLSQLKSMGKQAITIGILQAVITTVIVDIALIALHLIKPDLLSLPAAITLGAIASATAPAATLMVVRQYKADGPLTKLLLMVVAIDDAVGLILFSASFGIAMALELGSVSIVSVVLEPVIEIVVSAVKAIYSNKLNGKMAVVGNTTFLWKILHMPIEFFSQRLAGDLQHRQNSNAEIAESLINTFAPIVLNSSMMIFYLVVMIRYSVLLTLIGISSIVINLFLSQ